MCGPRLRKPWNSSGRSRSSEESLRCLDGDGVTLSAPDPDGMIGRGYQRYFDLAGQGNGKLCHRLLERGRDFREDQLFPSMSYDLKPIHAPRLSRDSPIPLIDYAQVYPQAFPGSGGVLPGPPLAAATGTNMNLA